MYRFRWLRAAHLVNFEPQNFKSDPEIANCGRILSSQAPSVSFPVPWLSAKTIGTNTDGARELRMRPQLSPFDLGTLGNAGGSLSSTHVLLPD